MKDLITTVAVSIAVAIAATPAMAQDAPDGKALYGKNCASCHGVQGTPSPAMAKAMKVPTLDSAFVSARGPDSLTARFNANGKHANVRSKIKPADLPAILEYIQVLSGAKK